MKDFVLQLCKGYTRAKIGEDPIRAVRRVEIPAIVGFALSKQGWKNPFVGMLLKEQKEQGYWEEFSYAKGEEKVGYYGAIPTAFCILSLVEAYRREQKESLKYAAIRGCDYLYRNEDGGYFLKASVNKTDVLNTNLMCAMALLETSKELSNDSRKIELYRAAANRAVLRSIKSQLPSGAFPYTYCGFTVPFLYHPMTLALLRYFYDELGKPVIAVAVRKGLRFLKKITGPGGLLLWEKSNSTDKQGACWAYGWSYACFYGEKSAERYAAHLRALKGKKFLLTGDFGKEEDPFFTAWTLFPLSLSFSRSLNKNSVFYYIMLASSIPPRLAFITKYAWRLLTKSQLDKGPVEYW